ncbi:MAG: hypothetical protein AUJ01_03410 [Acidobacteria bacterium 13_1_40CM_3_65_5]|nr:MAG: hypothetical protein AUJ01_03410 [Acidobacteria bacterium 13_1_40CM_3_65_5]
MPIPSLLLAAALVSTGLPPVHVALAFGSEPTLPPAVAAAAVHEAADIWSRYRVVVDRTMPCASAPDEAIVLTVRAGRSRIPSALDTPTVLGAINFAEDGTPYSILTVFFDLLVQSVGLARLGDVGEDRWPPELRRRARGHSSNGLMRAVQPFGELFGQSGAGFLLSRADERRLARRVVR